jgi:hypothetical protein
VEKKGLGGEGETSHVSVKEIGWPLWDRSQSAVFRHEAVQIDRPGNTPVVALDHLDHVAIVVVMFGVMIQWCLSDVTVVSQLLLQ